MFFSILTIEVIELKNIGGAEMVAYLKNQFVQFVLIRVISKRFKHLLGCKLC